MFPQTKSVSQASHCQLREPDVFNTHGSDVADQVIECVGHGTAALDPFDSKVPVRAVLSDIFREIEAGRINSQRDFNAVRKAMAVLCLRACVQGLFGDMHEMGCRIGSDVVQLDANGLLRLMALWPEKLETVDEFKSLIRQLGAAPNRPFRTDEGVLPGDPLRTNLQPNKQAEAEPSTTRVRPGAVIPLSHRRLQDLFVFLDRIVPTQFLPQQQTMAMRVVAALPAKYRGSLNRVKPEHIGVKAYAQVIENAAAKKGLPPVLQAFWNQCSSNRPIRKALMRNPALAAGLLGLLYSESVEREPAVQTESTLARQMVDGRPKTLINQQIMQWMRNAFRSRTHLMFDRLQKFSGFTAIDTKAVPSHFADIPCPRATAVQVQMANGRKADIHANHVRLDNEHSVIAAMQPVVTQIDSSEPDPEPLETFLHMASPSAKNVIIDLRTPMSRDPRDFEYCPRVLGEIVTVRDQDNRKIEIECTGHEVTACGLLHRKELRVQASNQPPRNLTVFRAQNWPDHGVIRPAELQQLRAVLDRQIADGAHVTVHCRAGVGRTGTLLAYAKAHRKIFSAGALSDMLIGGQLDRNRLLECVASAVIEGRFERGAAFVQTQEQLELIVQTLEIDISEHAQRNEEETRKPSTTEESPKNHDNNTNQIPTQQMAAAVAPHQKPESSTEVASASATSIETPVALAGHAVWLNSRATAIMMQEPKTTQERVERWEHILDLDSPIIEIISSKDRLGGMSKAPVKGLSWLTAQHIEPNGEGGPAQPIFIGSRRIDRIERLSLTVTNDNPALEAHQFRLSWTDFSKPHQPRTGCHEYIQIYTPFDGLKLKAEHLDWILKISSQHRSHALLRLVSAAGFGRPSAMLCAIAIEEEIKSGQINDEETLRSRIESMITMGRHLRGAPYFIHTSQQKDELLQFGRLRLKENERPHHSSTPSYA